MNPDHSISLAVNVSQSVSQWNAWPATGRSALQDLRSWAILQASLALSPVSSSICCTHVRQSLPKIFEARPIRLSISGVERSDEWISLPRYVKRPVDSTTWPCNCKFVIVLELVLPHGLSSGSWFSTRRYSDPSYLQLHRSLRGYTAT